ncbi:hypothetical protein Ait01nite_042270 [Actinoplanes italicus]|uniref:NACHT domain-containing protein n=1 Tax=Actinoplanes italicus TaxID=113567 RepID=A0A2T0K1J7_9ACTN|nr:NACHT domain-containing protein [Actinoplanes italicus]PRX16689.1 NACHT domain-containing protein [Actinoplanes italicus]GIE31182.1 hypothetical protein Ait01nite_042270 [Actinoplanes italicus]
MAAIESTVARAGGRAAAYIGKIAIDRVRRKALLKRAESLLDRAPLEAFLTSLTPAQSSAFLTFVESPQFEHLALQTTVWHLAGRSEDDLADIRHSARLSLRVRLEDLPEDRLLTGTDLVVHLLTVASEAAIREHKNIDSGFAVGIVADLAAATARRHELLERLPDLRAVDRFSRLLRAQVAATRSKMRLSHLGRRAGVEYADLHVDPTFRFPGKDDNRSSADALGQYQRVVVLGDPGAGKSTFAAKLAHDLADDALDGLSGRVPFLVVVREHAEALRTSHRPFTALLEDVAKAPYNVTPPADAIEYLLLSGSAVVIVDGVDELGDAEARRRLAELLEAFAHQYPLVGIVVTSRVVGYDEASFDHTLFPDIRIARFTDDQVADYAERWFTLEQDGGLAESFLAESSRIQDLRSNPLLLSLLCSLYESKHYIPANRAQIYENCAELLFERWDQGRGMSVPMRFGTHLRPAVAWLAWRMFTDSSAQKVLSRDKVADLLIEYMLEERFDDWTEAAVAAAEFLDYCAGRAWLLTEMGTRDGQRVYGFTHRTFLEYFTAVHLVRLGPSPESVWQRLGGRIPDTSWNNVAHLAVHRLERDAHGGASGFLELLLDAAVSSGDEVRYLSFAAEVAGQVALRSSVLRRLAAECVRLAVETPVDQRFRYTWTAAAFTGQNDDGPFLHLLQAELPENLTRLSAAILEALRAPGSADAGGLIGGILLVDRPWPRESKSVGDHLIRQPGLLAVEDVRRWEERLRRPSPHDIRTNGPGILYRQANLGHNTDVSSVVRVLEKCVSNERATPADAQYLRTVYPALAASPWPWIELSEDDNDTAWDLAQEGDLIADSVDMSKVDEFDATQRSSALLLLLVFLQETGGNEFPDALKNLLTARTTGEGRADALAQVAAWKLLPEAHELVTRWVNGEGSPVRRNR